MAIFAFGLEKIGLVCTRRPRTSLMVLVLITMASLFGLTRLSFDDDLRRLFRSNSDIYRTYERLIANFPAGENKVLLLVTSTTPMVKTQFIALRDLHLDLQFVKGVKAVTSIFSARHPPKDGTARPIIPNELPDGAALSKRLAQARGHPLIAGKLLSNDHRTALIMISLDADKRSFDQLSALLKEIDQIAGPILEKADLRFSATGQPASRIQILQAIHNDFHVLNLIGSMIAIAICILFFRNPRLIFIASVPPLIAVIWILGGFGLAQQPLTAINNVLPTLVLVIAFSDALHLVQAIRRKMGQGEAAQSAAYHAINEVGPACAMTSITTMIACLSLTLSGSGAIREFGMAAALAIFAAYLAIITLVPCFACLLLSADPNKDSRPAANWFNNFVDTISRQIWRLIEKKYKLITGLSLPLLIITGLAYFLVGTSYNYREYLSPQSPANLAIDHINDKLGGADSFYVLIERKKIAKTNAQPPEVIIRAVHELLGAQSEFQNIISAASIKDWIYSNAGRPRPDDFSFLADLPPVYANLLQSPSRQAWLVTAFMITPPAPIFRARMAKLDGLFETLRQKFPNYRIEPSGIALVGAMESRPFIRGLKWSLAGAVLITMIVIALTIGSISLALLAAIPNLLALTIIAALLYVMGSYFQITSVLALTVAFGIAVDNTIHILNRFRLERRRLDVPQALEAMLAKSGPVLIAAMAVLCCGLGATQLSTMPMVVLFGQLCIVVLFTALIAALVILPCLILATDRGRNKL